MSLLKAGRYILIGALFFFSLPAWALRCGNQVIVIGDTQNKVQRYCGKPTAKNKLRKPGLQKSKSKHKKIRQEIWIYNFGAQDFLYALTFTAGKVSDIETNGYGNTKTAK
jgi:hypothetical protein